MRKVLILMGRYLPGYRDGGPVRTIKNLTDILGKEYEFYIMCNDRDHGDVKAYPNIQVNEYNQIGNAQVYYVENGKFKFKTILKEINGKDVVYCCGIYGTYAIKVIMLKKLGLFKQKLTIASMGSFSKGALALKSKKKNLFLSIMKTLGLFRKIIWSVTSSVEENELKDVLGEMATCYIAEDLPRIDKIMHMNKKIKKELKIVFISRISKKKNLYGAIEILYKLSNFQIKFDIFGNIEDREYWKECKDILNKLPENIKWKYKGECNSNDVVTTFSNYDVFLFPTFGENFGHVISESLIAGCIPVISNTTPWNDFDKYECGNIVDLNNIEKFVSILNRYSEMTDIEFNKYVNNAQNYITVKNKKSIDETGYRRIFDL